MSLILVIDDDAKLLESIKITLVKHGHEVLTAAGGSEGIRPCSEHAVNLVITDIIMPDQDGLETIMDIRKRSPEVKIIAMSGGGRIKPDEYLTTALAMGANRTLAKPFRQAELLAAVEEVLKGE